MADKTTGLELDGLNMELPTDISSGTRMLQQISV
jgi:hypothetical protein